MTDDKDVQLNTRVTEPLREDMDEAVEQYEDLDSVSGLVRLSVAKELRRRESDEPELEEVHRELSQQIDDAQRMIRDLSYDIEEMHGETLDKRDLEQYAHGQFMDALIDTLDYFNATAQHDLDLDLDK